MEIVLDILLKRFRLGSRFRPINEVTIDNSSLRNVWWQPVPTKPLPNVLILTIVALAIFGLFGANIFLGIIGLGAFGYFIYNLQKKNSVPVDATSIQVLRDSITSSFGRAQNQSQVDLGLTQPEFTEALSQNLIFTFLLGEDKLTFKPTPIPIFRKLYFTTVVMTPRGIGYHSATYDLVENRFYSGESEMMLWNRISRVIRAGSTLKIESTSGSGRDFDLNQIPLRVESAGADRESVINSLVHPFVQRAQKYLMDN